MKTKAIDSFGRDIIKKKTKYQRGVKRELDEPGVDNDPGIDVPLHARGGEWKWNFEKKSFFDRNADKITWVLTAVNVAILISLVIKNI